MKAFLTSFEPGSIYVDDVTVVTGPDVYVLLKRGSAYRLKNVPQKHLKNDKEYLKLNTNSMPSSGPWNRPNTLSYMCMNVCTFKVNKVMRLHQTATFGFKCIVYSLNFYIENSLHSQFFLSEICNKNPILYLFD